MLVPTSHMPKFAVYFTWMLKEKILLDIFLDCFYQMEYEKKKKDKVVMSLLLTFNLTDYEITWETVSGREHSLMPPRQVLLPWATPSLSYLYF